jgi:hypothetical protein
MYLLADISDANYIAKRIILVVRTLDTHTQNYYLAKEQYAKWRSGLISHLAANTPQESEDPILEPSNELRKL